MLRGRERQRVAVDAVLDRARSGRAGVLVLRGEAGSGKTSLLRAARRAAADFTPGSRLALLCVDDAHRLDLGWLLDALPELEGEPVAVLIASEEPVAGLPTTEVEPLDHATSVRVLRDLVPGLPAGTADDVARTASGNPLALVELARSLTSAQLGGVEPPPAVLPPGGSLRARLRARLHALAPGARRALAMALVDDEVDVDALVRVPALEVADVQEAAALMDPRPVVRATLLAELPLADRCAAHVALAEALPAGPRRTWHEAVLAAGARDDHADRLAASAAAARTRGDFASAARDHGRAAALTTAPDTRARRLLSAAADHWRRGLPHRSRAVLREVAPLSDQADVRALADLVRGGVEVGSGPPDAAARRLVRAAGELLHRDRDLAVTALGLAGEAAAVAGDHALHRDAARLAATWRRPDEPPASRLTLDHLVGTAAGYAGRHDEAVPVLRAVVDLAERVPNATAKIRGGHAAHVLGDADRARALTDRGVDAAREGGLVALVPWALAHRALTALTVDGHEAALTAAFEGVHAATAAGQHNAVAEHLVILALLAALRGDADTARHRVDAAADQVRRLGLGRSGTVGAWASACADLVRDRPADALRRMRCATVRGVHAGIEVMASPDIVEAAVRAGEPDTADRALRRYEAWARSTGAPSGLAVSHRCRALVSAGPEAEEHFAEAVRLHRAAGTPLELAKTELFYANRLRRGRKPRRARELLHDAVRHFERYEADHWAERARAELRAAGEPVGQGPGRAADRAAGLTPQQRQIARLVAEGATNREVAARLFLSRRTVEHHLRNIFTRLDIRSRAELAGFVD